MRAVNLDHSAIIEPGGICAYSATTGAPIANTLNRSSWAHLGDTVLLPREQLPSFSACLGLEPSQIAALPSLEDAIFLAWPIWADGHWGHFLVEEVALLWAVLGARRLTKIPTLILPGYAKSGILSIRFLLEQQFQLHFTDDFIDHLLVKRLWSPVPTMFEGGPVHPSHFTHVVDVLQALDSTLLPPDHPDWLDVSFPSRVYLSRSSLSDSSRRVEAEQDLENLLSLHGWHVLHPQNLPLKDQIRYLINARDVAGTLGSALHTLMYLGRCNDVLVSKRVTILTSPVLRCLEATFRAQFEAQAIPVRFLECMQPCPGKAGAALRPWDSQYRFSLDLLRIAAVLTSTTPPFPAPVLAQDRAAESKPFIPRSCDSGEALQLINVNRMRLLLSR